jgi:hypothetical protein
MTVTPTITNTPINNQEPAINNIVIYPNPYNPDKGDLNIKFKLTQPVKTIKIRIFTSGFRLIKQITQENNFIAGQNTVVIDNRYLRNLANGSYLLVINATTSDRKQINSKPVVLIILR